MSFTSFNFIIFVTVFACVYFCVPTKYRWWVLLISSYAFYLIASPKSFIFVLSTTVSTFYGGRSISRCDDELDQTLASKDDIDKETKKMLKASTKQRKKKRMLAVLIFNLAILAVMKYFRSYIAIFANLLHIEGFSFNLGILIPLGISFYTFQSLSYIIDLYRGKYKADDNLAKYALFVSWFPLIVQGPISRYNQLASQLYEGHEFDYTRVKYGAQLMMWGFFKKLVIADRIAILVNTVFDNYTDYEGLYVIIAVTGYAIQIYADFSGGVDIAKGTSQIFGIELVNNFERPYFATNIQEFWRRWHMSLGNWCKDYIFYPISLSKSFGRFGKKLRSVLGERLGKLLPVIIAQLVTFVIIGVWHGSQLKYLAYGLYQAFFIIGGIIFEPQLTKLTQILKINTETRAWKLFQVFRTFVISVGGRYFSRASRFKTAVYMLKSSFIFNPHILFDGSLYALGLNQRDFLLLGICLLLWICISYAQEKGYSIREVIADQNITLRWLIYLLAALAIIVFGVYGFGYDASTFIYRGF